MEIIFILYKPGVPGNIGASARALKTMGFDKMRLIRPCNHLTDEAFMLAHGSLDILKSSEVYDSFIDAVRDIDILTGTTAKDRTIKKDYIKPSELKDQIASKFELVQKAGIIFGTEESGLPNEILAHCDLVSTIPMKTNYPSLNLSQAVMLYAYELAEVNKASLSREDFGNINFAGIKENICLLMKKAGIPEQMPIYHRILERISLLSTDDLKLVQSVVSRLIRKKE